MYIPKPFEETRIDLVHELIRAQPLATLVTFGAGELNANHIPLHLSPGQGAFGSLQGHVARANPIWKELASEVEALAIFHGPQSYISPSWYATKQESGKVVPTWNYTVVHAYGELKIIEDTDWIRRQMEALTRQSETAVRQAWQVSDAPQDYIEKMIGAVVGIEIVITRLHGKRKASQNQPQVNRQSAIAGLQAAGAPAGVQMAELMKKIPLS
jgi:transcriptional regulator